MIRHSLHLPLRTIVFLNYLLQLLVQLDFGEVERLAQALGVLRVLVQSQKLVAISTDSMAQVESLFEDSSVPNAFRGPQSTGQILLFIGEFVDQYQGLNHSTSPMTELHQFLILLLEGRREVAVL